MRRLIVLGNCVAQRLGLILASIFNNVNKDQPSNQWERIPATPVYNCGADEWKQQAELAASADLVFTQPLFNFGPCNTERLKNLHGPRVHVFSAPNFGAYFPDCLEPPLLPGKLEFQPPLEWHSKIFLQCYAAGESPEKAGQIYLAHPIFDKASIARAIDKAMALYERREKDVEIGSLEVVRGYYRKEPLFHSFRHPGDRIFRHLLHGMLSLMDYPAQIVDKILRRIPCRENPANPHIWSEWGFGFNAWPILTNRHPFFEFANRPWFRINSGEYEPAEAAKLWYAWYDAHPEQFRHALSACATAN